MDTRERETPDEDQGSRTFTLDWSVERPDPYAWGTMLEVRWGALVRAGGESVSAYGDTLTEAVWAAVAAAIRAVWMPREIDRLRGRLAKAEESAARCGIDMSGWGCD